MRKIHHNTFKGLALSASVLAIAAGGSAQAQDTDCAANEELVAGECVIQTEGPDGVDNNTNDAEDVVDVTDVGATGQGNDEAIVVTGSRIRRDTYTSISPLQVITTEAARDEGLFDPSQILQRDEAASGTQIDATFQGFVLDNGPGNQTVSLRSLGANRTLLLLNGRRLAPSGVGGAPTAPSINLLPGSLIERTDLLLDGASSVYGSDAVAGVVNVILKKDFDGLELFAGGTVNPMGAGDDYTVSASYGINLDRGFIGIGAEYDHRDRIRARDRDFLAGCTTDYEITQNGEIRTVELTDQVNALVDSGGDITLPVNECQRNGQGLRSSIIEPFGAFRVLYFTPGESNSGVPNYTESNFFFTGAPVDIDGDGVQDVRYADFSTNGAYPQLELIPEQNRWNVMSYGEYTLAGEANITPFFEVLYTNVDVNSEDNAVYQANVSVPDNNQFNPCNPNQPNGVDCYNASGVFNIGSPFLPFPVPQPVTSRFVIDGDRNNFKTNIEQYRGVFGVRGDLPFIAPSWGFEVSGSYTRSEGNVFSNDIREDKLAFAIGIDPTRDFNGDGIVDNDGDGIADDYDPTVDFGDPGLLGTPAPITPCDASQLANPELAAPDLLDGCVPVNLFAESVLGFATGDFATAAERNYVFGNRSSKTIYEQTVISGFLTGDLFTLPAGPVGAVFGLEWREDAIDSTTNFVQSNGLALNFFSDKGAIGSKWIREAFVELDVPLQAGKPLVQELSLNLSGRVTDEEYYGTAGTFSIKGGWRPIEPLLLRFSYGTSFRAPNLRENFLVDTTGFNTIVDPCAVPDDAFIGGVYVAEQDDREQFVLDNCLREGRDPTSVGLDFPAFGQPSANQITSVEISRQGRLDLEPETSRSITAGFAFEETFGDGWDVSLSSSYYDLKVDQSVVAISAQFAANDCYLREDGQVSQFCDALNVGTAPDDLDLITSADIGFLNLDTDAVRGVDFNAAFGKEFAIGGRQVEFGLDLRANHLIERLQVFRDNFGNETRDNDEGEFGLPRWSGRGVFSAEVDRWRLAWTTRWVGQQASDPDFRDNFSDVFGFQPDGTPSGEDSSTCTGFGSNGPDGGPDPIVAGDGVFCRDVDFADDWFEHAVSLRYQADDFLIRLGVSNIFDTEPPKVDCDELFLCISNIPIGAGYNLNGREFFATVEYRF